ncbi:hypothetical protein [Photobacterium sp. 1_MG-2023]|uniref:hypothetical protein n=1 Tax=Photobacterium sp. 1_MG-2023 TaxID=3062646 RepID=UPI0026E3ABCF|nr:hypothetical protein [Photobacterium sp. 1_MG-2023]MDO6707934.1 hypothetical protein [Photobacterium sp. 1_MG-2023]
MNTALTVLALLVEQFIQMKRRDDYADKQKRLRVAKSDPADYLRQFGRVRTTQSTMRSNTTGTGEHDVQRDVSNIHGSSERDD